MLNLFYNTNKISLYFIAEIHITCFILISNEMTDDLKALSFTAGKK